MMFKAIQIQLDNKFIVFNAEKIFSSVIFGHKSKMFAYFVRFVFGFCFFVKKYALFRPHFY